MKKLRTALPLPRYVRRKWLRLGAWAYFFEVPSWAKQGGCTLSNEALGSDYAAAVARAENVLLPAFDSWRTAGASDLVPSGPAPGSFDWMVAEFKMSPKFAALSPRTRKDHDRLLALLSATSLRDGRRFGNVAIGLITEGVVDVLYARVRSVVQKGEDGKEIKRERLTTANHAMASAQRAWNVARRMHPKIVPAVNPFGSMEREYSDQNTAAASLDQLKSFVAACDTAGHQSIGTAALIAWHWCVREEHILGQVLDGGAIRALAWSNYRPKDEPDSVVLVHWKTGERVVMPLSDEIGALLFPDLTARLDAAQRHGAFIVMRDAADKAGVHRPWVTAAGDLTHFRHTVRKIMDAADFPPKISFASFRHGGITESADADLTDRQMRALSGHRTAEVLDIYAKRTRVQRIAAAKKRLEFREKRERLSE
jgi:hypothetical protein